MSHIFNEKHFKKLDSPERRKILPIDKVIESIQLDENMIVADVGCGIGYFSFPFSQTAKKVYGIDISEVMIEELEKRNKDKLVIPILGDFKEKLSEKVHVFFTSTVIHELPDLKQFTRDAIDKLDVDGRLIYLDFQKKETGFGPSVEKRVASDDVVQLFESLGLKDIENIELNDVFYLVIGKK
ncbi:class I SAM-dependent methyltransferase [Acidaminobacter sp. JC074]|uniref:class I SAM-dependent methyltransferase n=1 Tax=Acidaminobacter sp. JC074 TaxID=2530199 RepID=UPI001F0EDBB7|nr:methyltransferase domain-containing protein [Acidaminobacter sp. JC074]MCH4891391.1 class I SAM-dependent methyltransferase [Acidaminobacter sp. JC074]